MLVVGVFSDTKKLSPITRLILQPNYLFFSLFIKQYDIFNKSSDTRFDIREQISFNFFYNFLYLNISKWNEFYRWY